MSTWISPESINLIRYLFVLQITHPLVVLPPYLPAELSYVLGTMIAERLPTGQAKHWRRMVAAWEEASRNRKKQKQQSFAQIPDVAWPVESVWLAYPGKRAYGRGELILGELKLLGDSASHSYFLEVILPALEDAGITADTRWKRPRSLWGRFEVHAVHVARGAVWEPLVVDGNLDLGYRPTPNQWAEGLTFGTDLGFSCRMLKWLTPFHVEREPGQKRKPLNKKEIALQMAPSLAGVLQLLLKRIRAIRPKGRGLDDELETAVAAAAGEAAEITMESRKVRPPPRYWPGVVWGRQRFSLIPPSLLPYLELASILHIGGHTHLGCGTFTLS